MPLEKPIDSITEADIRSLMTNQVAEGRHIEYKGTLPDNSYESTKELLADVSSFANAVGGHLLFGVAEDHGLPVGIPGLSDIDPDAELLRLENTIRDNIEPRLPGVMLRAIPLATSAVVILLRIPHSWAQPHVVHYRKHWRFYTRSSAGKYPLDVPELRAAFALSQTLAERVRSFRTERLGSIVGGETPVHLQQGAKLVLHIIPFASFDPAATHDISALGDVLDTLTPINGYQTGRRYNFDGFLAYDRLGDGPAESYAQLFRTGIVEAVASLLLKHADTERTQIPSSLYEKQLIDIVPRYLSIQKQLGVSPPLLVMLSLIGVKGYVMALGGALTHSRNAGREIDRDTLILPEIMIESFEVDIAQEMRPIFDSVWNACGWAGSMNYDASGRWGRGLNNRS